MDIVFFAIILFVVLRVVISFLAERELNKEVIEGPETPPQIPLTVDEVNGVFYLYTKDTNRFIAQGSTQEEIIKHIKARNLGLDFILLKEEANKVRHIFKDARIDVTKP